MRTTSGHFDLWVTFMGNTLKDIPEPISIDEQIENLISLNLIVEDVEFVRDFLSNVSYFRFIKAYSLGLKQKNGCYYKDVSFKKLAVIYEFNNRLRQIIFPLIEKVEITLRCKMTNYLCQKYNNLMYLNKDNFANLEFHERFIRDFDDCIIRNQKRPFIKNFKLNYKDGSIPLYAAVEIFSFGMLSRFYSNLIPDDKKAIAKEFNVGYTYFDSWIESISFVRNICAHYGRIYNVKLSKQPKVYTQYSGVDNYRIFAVILAIKHIIQDKSLWLAFKTDLFALIDTYGKDINLAFIGFTEDWNDYL